ncbi:MAG TPA: hypothetical protein DCY20_09670 [Firmicutes bacterium]|nr:hypothetical protein [Bacillota bacterium]
MNENNNVFTLDYVGKYHFYEEDDFVSKKEQGQYILDQLKVSHRFDYDHATYTFTKYGNISEGRTEKNVALAFDKDSVNVKLNDEVTHLDLIYKMDVKQLEDHYRVTTRISERADHVSVLLYIKLADGERCLKELEGVKAYQEKLANTSASS